MSVARITFVVGMLSVIAAAPCWIEYLGYAFAYSAWIGLDPKKFPIAAAQSSADQWMLISGALQIVGIALMVIGATRLTRYIPVAVCLCLIPASFLPTVILIQVLAHQH